MSEAYREAGVNLELGDILSKMLYEASKNTWPNREGVYGEIRTAHDSFSGLRSWGIQPLLEVPEVDKLEFDQDADGIGTKVEVSQRTSTYETAAHDLFAMTCDDPAARGFEPVIVTTVFDVNKLNDSMRPSMRQLASGMVEAAAKAKVAVKGGEAAELGACVGGYGDPEHVLQYNWSATVHAVGHRARLISGQDIRPGDSLVAFREKGFRSNGLSLVRKTLQKEFGPEWHRSQVFANQKLGELVLRPSVIYSNALVDMFGGYDLRREPRAPLHGVAHITGGGMPEKVARMLEPTGYGAEIEVPYEPTQVMKLVQDKAGVADEEIYRVINMGQGMVVATPLPALVREVATKHGIQSQEVGKITKDPVITIRSRGTKDPGKKLVYNC